MIAAVMTAMMEFISVTVIVTMMVMPTMTMTTMKVVATSMGGLHVVLVMVQRIVLSLRKPVALSEALTTTPPPSQKYSPSCHLTPLP